MKLMLHLKESAKQTLHFATLRGTYRAAKNQLRK